MISKTLLFLTAFNAGMAFGGCVKSQPAKVAAEAAYTEQLLDCVDKSETYVESRACRAQVNARWGLLPDGGK